MDCQEIKLIIIFYHINFISLNHFVISFLIIYLSIYLSSCWYSFSPPFFPSVKLITSFQDFILSLLLNSYKINLVSVSFSIKINVMMYLPYGTNLRIKQVSTCKILIIMFNSFYGQEMYLVSKLLASCQQQYLQKIYIVLFLI